MLKMKVQINYEQESLFEKVKINKWNKKKKEIINKKKRKINPIKRNLNRM